MHYEIDGALYPDREPPSELESLPERVDFLARLCSAWDFGRLPDRATIDMIRGADWRQAVDETRLLTSCAYHLIRAWHDLPRLLYLGQEIPEIRDDPNLQHV